MGVLKETAAGKKLLSLAQDLLRGHFGFPGETSYLSQLLHVYCAAGPAPRSITVSQPVWGAQPGLSLAEDLSHLVASCSCKSFRQNGMCLHAYALTRCVAQDVERGQPSTGVRSLIASFGPPPVEEQLADLDRLLLGVESLPRAEQIAAWVITLSRSALKTTVMTRRRLKNGTWGVPRSAPYNPVDILEASAIEQDRTLSRRLIGVDFPRFPLLLLLEALAGHPHVHVALDVPGDYPPVPFNPAEIVERASPFRVERQPAALTVREEGDLLAIHATFTGHLPAGEPFLLPLEGGLVGVWPGEQRLIVGRWEPEVATVVHQILRLELRVPRAAGDALVMKLEALERRGTPILLPPALAGREVPADERVVLACEPIVPQGAAIAIGFRPIPGARRVEPGAAPARFNAMVGGERLTAIRRLDRERAHAERLISELALPLSEEDPWRVLLPIDGDVLEMVARLRDPAFADVVVEWPQDPPRLVGTPIRALRVSIQAKRDWFDVEGSIEVDGQVLALAELLSAAREGRRFVQVGQGRFVEIERTFQARLARLADLVQSERGGLSLARTIAPHAADAFEGFEVVAPVAWNKLLARVEECRTQTPELPVGFIGELRPYQLDGFRWLWRLARMGIGGCLADDMGLGKTVQAIAMLVERAPLGPQLVVAPTSVGFNWIRELARFAPGLRARDLRGADRKSMLSQAAAGDVIVASYGLLRQEIDLLGEKRFSTVVLDEAQAFKNFETQTAKAVRALQSDWSIALTGTPVENHLGELYSLVHTVAPGLLGSWDRFAKSFGRPIERERRSDRQQALSRLLRPFILRRTKGEVLKDLPSRTEIRLDALLSRPERALYEASRLDTVARLSAPRSDGPRDARFEVLAALTRLRQLASHARMVEPQAPRISAKLAVLLEQLDEVLDEDHTALIFSQFTRQLRLIREVLEERKIESLYLDGETPAAERERLVHAFQAGGAKVFLVSLKAGGTGLNLTAADYVFLIDPWWNPAVEDQAADRAHRIGQMRPVTIVRIVAKGTVEEKVLALHAEKRKLVAGILDGADLAGRLSTDDLIDLLKEGAQDVEDEPVDLRVAPEPPAPRAKAAGQRSSRR